MKLTPAQEKIAKDKHRFRIVNCGRRFGKTTLAIEEMLGKALSRAGTKIAYIAPTYQQARDIAWEQLKSRSQPIVVNINESRLEIRLKSQEGGESIIYLRGWESIESLRGLFFDFLVIDEVAMMRNFWVGWQEVMRPTLTDRKGEVMFISTPKGFNHFYDLYQLEKVHPNAYKSFTFTTYDNPFIPKEEIDDAKRELPENKFAQEYLASFRKSEGLVYKEFMREKHVYTDEDTPSFPFQTTILGVDFGYTNPSCVLEIKQDTSGKYWIADEWYKTGKTNIEIVEYCKSKEPNYVYADPAEPDRIAEMEKHGLYLREVSKDIVAGVDRVRALFKENKINIHVSCKNLIMELESYSYPDKKPDRNEEEKPIKENDHAVDALRYALFMNSRAVEKKEPNIPSWDGYKVRNTKPEIRNFLRT